MDFRLPGLDGAEATAAVRAAAPGRAVLCLTAEATAADRDAVLAAGAVGLIEKGRPIDDLVRAIHSATERGESDPVNLTSENTAIVLDSTSDFPEAGARALPEHAGRAAATSSSATRASSTTSSIGSHDFYERLQGRADAADDVAADAAGLPATRTRSSRGTSGSTRSTCRRSSRAPIQSAVHAAGDARRRPDPASSTPRPRRSRSAMLALAIQRRLARGTTDEEIEELIDRFKRDNGVVFTVGTLEYLQKGGRIGRAQALAGTLLNVKPILSVRRRRGRSRSARCAAARRRSRSSRRVFTAATENAPGLRVAIAHADAPEWIDVLTDLVAEGAAAGGDRARREPRRRRRHACRARAPSASSGSRTSARAPSTLTSSAVARRRRLVVAAPAAVPCAGRRRSPVVVVRVRWSFASPVKTAAGAQLADRVVRVLGQPEQREVEGDPGDRHRADEKRPEKRSAATPACPQVTRRSRARVARSPPRPAGCRAGLRRAFLPGRRIAPGTTPGPPSSSTFAQPAVVPTICRRSPNWSDQK